MSYQHVNRPTPPSRPEDGRGIKSALLDVVKQARKLGFNAREAAYLRYLVDLIPARNLLQGDGLLWSMQATVARELQCSPQTVRRVEFSLEAAGMIERRTAANGRRSHEDQLGISIGPMIRALPNLLARIARFDAAQQAHTNLLIEIKTLRARILRMIADGLPSAMAARIASAMAAHWPRQISTLKTAPAKQHRRHLLSIIRWIDLSLEHYLSGGALKSERSNTPLEENIVRKVQEAHRRRVERKEGLKTLDDLRNIATPDMQFYLDALAHGQTGMTSGQAAMLRSREIGIDSATIEYTICHVGPDAALTMVTLIDANRDRPFQPVQHPSAYLRSLVSRALAGRLNLAKSLRALRSRRKNSPAFC